MAISTKLQPKYTFRMVAIAVVSLVLGLWGVYDYLVVIPSKARAYEWHELAGQVRDALVATPGTTEASERVTAASAALEVAVGKIRAELPKTADGTDIDPETAREWIKDNNQEQSLAILALFGAAVTEASQRSASTPLSPAYQVAHDLSKAIVDETGDVTPPGKFDRATQWFFMLCLPCVPYFMWMLWKAKKRVYRLDDDGTLHAPGERWSRDEIAGIDMSRWMSKSVAQVEHVDGRRLKLDDYLYKNVHLIAGAIASERHPDEWDSEAKPVKHGEDGGGEDDAGAAPDTAEAGAGAE